MRALLILGFLALAMFVSPPRTASGAAGAAPPDTVTVAVRGGDVLALLRHRFGGPGGTIQPCRNRETCRGFAPDLTLHGLTVDIRSDTVIVGTPISGSPFPSRPVATVMRFRLRVSDGKLLTRDVDVDVTDRPVRSWLIAELSDGRGWDILRHLSNASADPRLPGPRLPVSGCVRRQDLAIVRVRLNEAANEILVQTRVSPRPSGASCP